ncbi:MAG: hypothetical protein U1E22_04685, partial [Coriobacteriia bacterium]|nr:hypothetical protein [Coriobacteriia bacterium]
MSGCQSSVSGYAGVYDLIGNAFEWEDSCDGNFGIIDSCRLRGGHFGSAFVGASTVDVFLRCGF